MKNGQKYLCIKEYKINDDSLFTKGKVYTTIKRHKTSAILIECDGKLPSSTYTTMPIDFFQGKIAEYLVTEKQIRKLKLDKLNLIYKTL
jgi:hypothetical protein